MIHEGENTSLERTMPLADNLERIGLPSECATMQWTLLQINTQIQTRTPFLSASSSITPHLLLQQSLSPLSFPTTLSFRSGEVYPRF
mmetsp:Transcript_5624/g.11267  ORF Transcript_5624/g.11267 Transcript_5624/m.11267 type:complete len:87 (-) Transcript_5624:44-304(-)